MFFIKGGFRSLLILLMCWGFSGAETPMKMGVRLGAGISSFDDYVKSWWSDGELMGVGLEGAYGVLMPIGSSSISFHPELAIQYTYVENNTSNISLTEMNLLLSPLFRYDWSRMFFELGPSMNWNIYNEWSMGYPADRQISFGPVAGPGFKFSENVEVGVRYSFWWMPYEKKNVGNNNFFGILISGSYWF